MNSLKRRIHAVHVFVWFNVSMIYAVAVVVPIHLVDTCKTKTAYIHFPEKAQSKTLHRISVKQIEDTWKRELKSQEPQLSWKMDLLFEALTLYLLINEPDVFPSQIFSIHRKTLEFHIKLKTYQFSFCHKTLVVISKKLEGVKARLQINDKWFFDCWTVCHYLSCLVRGNHQSLAGNVLYFNLNVIWAIQIISATLLASPSANWT